jgi:lysophospholipase L1-like esterase
MLREPQGITWVFTGDSITHGGQHTHGWRNYTELFSERVRWELRRFQDVVINTAVAGERSDGLLENLDVLALRFQPDVVSVMIGVFDAADGPRGRKAFRDQLQRIIERIRENGAVVLLHTPHRFRMDDSPDHADMRSYVRIIREIACDLDVACVDHWAHWKRRRPNPEELRGWLDDDGIHPDKYGHRELAKLIFARLGIFDEHSPTCNAKSP